MCIGYTFRMLLYASRLTAGILLLVFSVVASPPSPAQTVAAPAGSVQAPTAVPNPSQGSASPSPAQPATTSPGPAQPAPAPAGSPPGPVFVPTSSSPPPGLPSVPAPSVAASSWILVDLTSGQVLHARDADQKREPASLTKLMTAYLAFAAVKQKSITLDQKVNVSTRAWKAEGSRMFIDPKVPVSIDDLLHGMIIQSGNDASVLLAETIAGSEEAFAQAMTREAQRLGMKNTNFVNATGLAHPQHYSTAADMAILAAAIIRDFPEFFPLYSIKEYRYNNITQPNRNRLLWTDPYVDGMKTGFTDNAGYCLVSTAKRGPRRILSVVMGAASDSARAIESQKLLNFGFQFYDTPRLYEKNQMVTTLPVWKGAANQLKAGFTDDLYLTLPKGVGPKLKVALDANQPLTAPIAQGQVVGTLKLVLDGKPIVEYPVKALEEVPQAGIFGRAWDSVRLMFK